MAETGSGHHGIELCPKQQNPAAIINHEISTQPNAPHADIEPVPYKSTASTDTKAHAVTTKEDEPQEIDALPAYSALSEFQRSSLLMVASLAAAISPASTTTYYPAVTSLARDLHVSVSLINLSISTYQIFQGLAPSVTAAFSDWFGRRPAYILCLTINFAANLGLALQNDYAFLMVLRCIQSSGSSGTVALAQAVLDDLTTSEQRGKYLAYMSIGFIMGPALGPAIGGLLSQFLGWRAIFWFLLILGGFLMITIVIFFPETNRSIVGDGSIPPPIWNRSLFQLFREDDLVPNRQSLEKKVTGINPLISLRILANKENFIVCVYGSFLFAGFSSLTSVLASQLQERYHYNEVQVGLCYLPIGIGSIFSRWTTAKLIDRNFRRQAEKQGISLVKNRKQDISAHNIERARLAIAFPLILATCALALAYGFLMQHRTPIAAVLTVLFLLSNFITGALVANTALLTDLNLGHGAALGAAMNLTRCLMGAGGVAAVTPLIDKVGIGWAATVIAGIWMAGLPALWLVYRRGFEWRKAVAVGGREGEGSAAARV